ncbi:Gtf3a [Columba guinea]|nr:Gtf3a [Columba guinea]
MRRSHPGGGGGTGGGRGHFPLAGGHVSSRMAGERAAGSAQEGSGGNALPTNRFICSFPDCDATFNKAWRLDVHLCRHTGQFICRCTADGCNQRFVTQANLKKHIKRKHENQQKQYVNKKYVDAVKEIKPLYFIPRCSNEGCGKYFSTPSRLKRHEKIHEGYACKKENCSYTAKTWTELLKHNKESHTEPIVCSTCYKTFKRKDYLKQHQKTHAVEREVYGCPREGCGRTYTTVFNLQSHILSFHEEKKTFSCDYPGCGRVFAMKAKRSRPKRSLASRLSGYIPPKTQPGKDAVVTETKTMDKPMENEIPTVEILTLQ